MNFTRSMVVFLAAGVLFAAFGQTYSGLSYATVASDKLDIYMPTGGGKPYPVIVWIHGGGFSSGSRTEGNASQLAGMFGRLGVAIVSIDYRLSGVAQWPAQIQDCKAAIRWIRANAATYTFDPNRIGAAGGSAGGHLSSMLGTAGGIGLDTLGTAIMDLEGTVGGNNQYSSGIQAVCDMYGPIDLLSLNDACPQGNPTVSTIDHDAAGSPEGLLMGAMIQTIPDKTKMASPLSFVSSDDPPFLIVHGDRDASIPVCQSIKFSDSLKKAFAANKKECTLIQLPTQGHGFSVTVAQDSIIAFFTRTLVSNTPTIKNSSAGLNALPHVVINNSYFSVVSKKPFALTISDAQGRVLLSKHCEGSITAYSATSGQWGSGLRVCTIQTENAVRTFTFVKNR